MDRKQIQQSARIADRHIAAARGCLLIAAQTNDFADLSAARQSIDALGLEIAALGLSDAVPRLDICRRKLSSRPISLADVYESLDVISKIEASIFDRSLMMDEFHLDLEEMLDTSLAAAPSPASTHAVEVDMSSELDEETLEIFSTEAADLLAQIRQNLERLNPGPSNGDTLWEVRRNVHTLKGAAGIVGFSALSKLAHRLEDVLDGLVDRDGIVSQPVLDLIKATSSQLDALAFARGDEEFNLSHRSDLLAGQPKSVAEGRSIGQLGLALPKPVGPRTPVSKPIVRVSLDRLQELIGLSQNVIDGQSALFKVIKIGDERDIDAAFETHRKLSDELHARLLSVRMVRFATLETRLNRAVNATCADEGKRASVELEKGETEIDTQLIDALIEPLLHLLKNGVVHGIEPPETRRLIGKPEKGLIKIKVNQDAGFLELCVSDDGAGISIAKLRAAAIARGTLTAEMANSLSDVETIELIFDRGLTTAARLDLNAGRGVGMSIVKESIVARGGTVSVKSELQRGTRFTIRLPIAAQKETPTAPETCERKLADSTLILIVDDSETVRRHNSGIVQASGLKTITAADGAEALELLLSDTIAPDLILSDVEMPIIDGWQFLDYVKTNENFGHIPVVMVTSLASDDDRQRAASLGAADYIVKPLTIERFETVLASLAAEAVPS